MIRELVSEESARFDAAFDTVIALTLKLASATKKFKFMRGVRIGAELERELIHAQEVAEGLPDGAERAEGLRRLSELQATAIRLLMIAPSPTPAAIEAASAGDDTLLRQEEHAWIAHRLACGSSLDSDAPRRRRGDALPACSTAFRDSAEGGGDETTRTTAAGMIRSPARPASNKERAR